MLIYRLLLAMILTYILLKYVLPKVLCISFEGVLILAKFLEFCEVKKIDRTKHLSVRMFYLFAWLIAWALMLSLFLPTQILFMIERFGGFVNRDLLDCSEEKGENCDR